MQMRWTIPVVLWVTWLAACSSPEDVLGTLPTLAPAEGLLAPRADSGGGAPSSGRLAYVGEDDNIYVTGPGSEEALTVTDDANLEQGETLRVYTAPTWSPGGWLSFVKVELPEGQPIRYEILATLPGQLEMPRQLLVSNTNYIYGYWSPAECDLGDACGRFAFLMSGQSGIELHMAQVRSDDEDVEERVLGEGQPFYYSWAPDGERMLWLRGGETLEVVDVNDTSQSAILADVPGLFQAPMWSPVDERLLFALAGESGNRLVIADGEERSELTGDSGSLSAFSWSPDGQRLAYAEGFAPTPYPFSVLRILNADGSDAMTLPQVGAVIAFFWSPDSQRLAFVTVHLVEAGTPQARAGGNASPAQQEAVLVWHVADLQSRSVSRLAEFYPTTDQLYIMQYFDQFAQSINVWSPDSSQIVYSELLPGGDEVVRLLDVEDGSVAPLAVAPGSVGVFSFN